MLDVNYLSFFLEQIMLLFVSPGVEHVKGEKQLLHIANPWVCVSTYKYCIWTDSGKTVLLETNVT